MTCAIIIVTYNPDKDTLSYIANLTGEQNQIIVVDNSTSSIDLALLEQQPQIEVIRNGGNLGLALALNQGVDMALEKGINDIFLFDQDSRIPEAFIEKMLAFKREKAEDDCVVIAPNFIDTNIGTEARFSILEKWHWHNVSCSDRLEPLNVSFAITSGSLLDGRLYKKLGPFREDYFIDHVDSEYCLRASTQNMKIQVNCNVTLRHTIGARTIKKFLGITIKPNHHSPVRRYYIFRNGTRVSIEYGKNIPSVISLNIARLIHEILSVLLYEHSKWKKIKAMMIGLWHGIVGHMGPAPTKVS